MTKRLVISAVLLLFCFSLCFVSYFSLNFMTDELKNQLEAVCFHLEEKEFQKAFEQSEITNQKWEKFRPVMAIFLEHDAIEGISVDIPTIKNLSNEKSADEAFELCQKAINSLKEIMEEQKISIANIL
ncbi:MAG: DUF4363 family protein [Clostridia bacterium]|nr:DUF4363 family protein [Clostridia bacterium]